MLKDNRDNQLSTVLLLVALGFLIYQLTKPKTIGETFADTTDPNAVKTALQENQTALPEAEHNIVMHAPVVKPTLQVPTAEVRPEILQQIIAESEQRAIQEKIPVVSEQITQPVTNPVFNFEPNDYNVESGATLENAFQRPIPQQARPDEVPINKNNLSQYDSKDFLPKEINSEWFDTDFSQAKHNINDDKLINTERYVIGVNTVGQSLKNASYDIRGTIANPKFTVSPWNNSTFEPDYNIRPLC